MREDNGEEWAPVSLREGDTKGSSACTLREPSVTKCGWVAYEGSGGIQL